ncbi:MAG TPA: GTP-binding protein, partial [Candidatus Aenigmarchaeota archaeon]|nr:GTP-binding protein [Candidatus Aenigmarchaeota archaeon]
MNKRVLSMIRRSHIVLEVIDIRCPLETRCRALEERLLREGKPFIRVFNKADLVPKEFAEFVVSKMKGIYVSSKTRKGLR